MISTEDELRKYQAAADAVCIECMEDTAGDETVCDRCPVRKTYECTAARVLHGPEAYEVVRMKHYGPYIQE